MNVCMVGYGMMGAWHSEALQKEGGTVLHTAVGRRAEGAREFAERFCYKKWTVSLEEALADPAVQVVILATPSDQHEAQAIQCLEAGKHTLIEIPIAMSLKGAERVVAAGERSGKVYGLSHPMRFRREREQLSPLPRRGGEDTSHRRPFFIKAPDQYRRDRLSAELDRQHSLAPFLPFRRSRIVPVRRCPDTARAELHGQVP